MSIDERHPLRSRYRFANDRQFIRKDPLAQYPKMHYRGKSKHQSAPCQELCNKYGDRYPSQRQSLFR